MGAGCRDIRRYGPSHARGVRLCREIRIYLHLGQTFSARIPPEEDPNRVLITLSHPTPPVPPAFLSHRQIDLTNINFDIIRSGRGRLDSIGEGAGSSGSGGRGLGRRQ